MLGFDLAHHMRCIMSMRYYFSLISLLLMFHPAVSYGSFPNTHLVDQIKPNPTAGSKPSYLKFAAVSFLQSDTNLSFGKGELDVKTQCASLGYTIPASSCSGVMQAGKPCSDEASMSSVAGAENYVLSCCNSQLYTVDHPDKCDNNSVALTTDFCEWGGKKMYRCKCDRTQYPYGDDHSCSDGAFNAYSSCTAPTMSGGVVSSKTFYSSCCPSSYEVCTGKYVGDGRFCGVDTGGGNVEVRYENCKCHSSYDTICDGMMIDVSDFCVDDLDRKLTRDSNCEGGCTKTSETNVDDYLYGKIWHCLYKDDGANVKPSEGRLCDGYNFDDNNLDTSDITTNFYDLCKQQGFIKRKEDCYVGDLILYCPSDSSKVWCLESKYCTGYDVGSIAGDKACHAGANVDVCSGSNNERCKYYNEECNRCWNDGEYNSENCQNLDTSTKGDSQKCCKLGYIMRNGICEVNNCATQTDSGGNLLYPYEDKNPGVDAGELEICYQGDASVDAGYKVYYGYSSCYSDASEGGMWMASVDNPRKCICNRKDDTRGWLPFSTTLYFDTNSDTTENYTKVGFSQGAYGHTTTCTDSEGSYYGYSACYIGSYMGTAEANKGMCLSYGQTGNSSTYPYQLSDGTSRTHANLIFNAAIGKSISTPSKPTTNMLPDYNKVYCINQRQHCPNNNCDADVLALTKNPSTGAQCIDGTGEECRFCYHTINLDSNGKWHGKFKFIIQSYSNGGAWFAGFKTCPTGYIGGIDANAYGTCFKYCSISALSNCKHGDILTTDGTSSGTVVGVVYYTNSSNVYIAALTHASGKNQADAHTYANTYAPANVSDSRFVAGKWHLPTRAQMNSTYLQQYAMYRLSGTYRYLGKSNLFDGSWASESGYTRNCCDSATAKDPSATSNAVPVIICPVGGGACS